MPSSMPTNSPKEDKLAIGILEVQGAFNEHNVALRKAQKCFNIPDLEIIGVRYPDHISDKIDGLIIPGGESTTISLFLKRNKMDEPLRKWIDSKNHVTWGTCAGMILLSKQTENQKIGGQPSLAEMDIDVSRNFFGRQINSFEAPVNLKQKLFVSEAFKNCDADDIYHGVFIRAPAVVEICSPEVTVLATLDRSGSQQPEVIVAVQQGNMLATAFHPELTDDVRWHAHFIEMICTAKRNSNVL
ncbi:pyridoxal 5'-phosphate synthase subunit PdxT-like [Mytilus californianus]|uniref:pyridoxal 5'-phosphate synthase subunit PdxT-like n=1 Tax=Mytilus californianus TaxID=6549 RepID=UPI002246DC2C|nr:pyridoxal 5'-phosphate synthase subunit PdxT-like [Mytilus californianus]